MVRALTVSTKNSMALQPLSGYVSSLNSMISLFTGFARTPVSEFPHLKAASMCTDPARSDDYPETWQHSVVLSGLEPGEKYQYMVADDPTVYFFTAAPPVGSSYGSRFVMYGDMGVNDVSAVDAPGAGSVMDAVQKEVESKGSDFVLHVGDISYGDGRGAVWDAFMKQISPFASGVPYMVGTGNHDYDYRYGVSCMNRQ